MVKQFKEKLSTYWNGVNLDWSKNTLKNPSTIRYIPASVVQYIGNCGGELRARRTVGVRRIGVWIRQRQRTVCGVGRLAA